MYNISRKVANGEILMLAVRRELDEAKKVLATLNEHWPGDYLIQDAETGADVEL